LALIGTIPPGTPAPALHEHPTTDEAFYCAAGEASFKLGDEELSVAAGSLVFVPRGTVHTAWNAGSEDVRGIIFITPGDVEHEFVEV
jgi:quercetin dioxygenase-like cupin family protein